MPLRNTLAVCTFFLLIVASPVTGEEKQKPAGPPPMLVTTAEVVSGTAEPMSEFVGTVYYARTAQVAAEVAGLVEVVPIKDGDAVAKGAPLVTLDDDILAAEIAATQANLAQSQLDFDQAVRDYHRIASLHEQDAIATTEYEAYGTRAKNLEQQVMSLQARLDKQQLEQKKKTVRAPFTGLVIESLVEPGEWVPVGGKVALVADNRTFEIQVDIPVSLAGNLEPGREVSVKVNNQEQTATFSTIIPRGDIATRTVSAKFRLGAPGLIEGMEANVRLPIAAAREGLLVPRDAVTNSFGQNVVFTIVEGLAKMLPVQVVGHTPENIAVNTPDLQAGQRVITKGNERIRDGQPVRTE